jgi:hypothetical protein
MSALNDAHERAEAAETVEQSTAKAYEEVVSELRHRFIDNPSHPVLLGRNFPTDGHSLRTMLDTILEVGARTLYKHSAKGIEARAELRHLQSVEDQAVRTARVYRAAFEAAQKEIGDPCRAWEIAAVVAANNLPPQIMHERNGHE